MLATEAAEPHPQSGAWITPKMSTAIPAVDRAKPRQSIGRRTRIPRGRHRTATRAAIAPATMAMKTKMLPHQNRSRSHPPTIGPVAMPIPVVAPHSPMAMARSPRSVKTLTSSESVDGNMNAAPSPMTAREATARPSSLSQLPPNFPERTPPTR